MECGINRIAVKFEFLRKPPRSRKQLPRLKTTTLDVADDGSGKAKKNRLSPTLDQLDRNILALWQPAYLMLGNRHLSTVRIHVIP